MKEGCRKKVRISEIGILLTKCTELELRITNGVDCKYGNSNRSRLPLVNIDVDELSPKCI